MSVAKTENTYQNERKNNKERNSISNCVVSASEHASDRT